VTASRADTFVRLLLTLLVTGLAACQAPGGAPVGSAFRPPLRRPPPPPDVVHRTSAELARAALVDDEEKTQLALRRLENLETVLRASGEPPTGLMPVAIDLNNTTLDDNRAYLGATEDLLDRKDLDPALRKRLEIYQDDDPLELASDRIRDAILIEVARAFNSLAEPIGRSIMSHQLAPYRLGRSLVNYMVQVYSREALSLQRRQALAHWKEFLERHPDAPESEEIAPKVESTQAQWSKLQRDRAMRVGRMALGKGKVRLALVYADRALRHVPEDRAASELRDEAAARLLELRDKQRRSLEPGEEDSTDLLPQRQRAVAVAMFAPGGDALGAARELYAADPEGPLADEALYIEAFSLGEEGEFDAMWAILEALAEEDGEDSNMARHAAALVNNPQINTRRAFDEARSRDRWNRARWVLLGPFYRGVPSRGLPMNFDYVMAAPSIAESMMGTPMRLLNLPWAESLPSARVTAIMARRHLERHPEDPRNDEIREWLLEYEIKRNNWIAALDLEESRPDADLALLAQYREQAARQYLEAALREKNLGLRLGMYRRLSVIYPGSRASRVAGELAATESKEATAQRIRVSRGFLEENPSVAGPEGLDLRPALMDEDPTNSELHPHGVTLLGGQVVEVSYLSESGKDKDPPRRVREHLSEEHLARVVSQLEETAYRNALLDPLAENQPDARRDLYFERARLGLAGQIDQRPSAISQFSYQGIRERYGMVRARESILPFDLVVSGDIHSLSLGAFPRMRKPKETPDAMLYR